MRMAVAMSVLLVAAGCNKGVDKATIGQARTMVGAIKRAALTAWERDQLPSGSFDESHVLCKSSPDVPGRGTPCRPAPQAEGRRLWRGLPYWRRQSRLEVPALREQRRPRLPLRLPSRRRLQGPCPRRARPGPQGLRSLGRVRSRRRQDPTHYAALQVQRVERRNAMPRRAVRHQSGLTVSRVAAHHGPHSASHGRFPVSRAA